jgi:TrpR family trp operon transcriptional repressor
MRNKNANIGKREGDELVQLILSAAKNESSLRALLADLLTPSELHELVARWQIVKRIASGMPQRDIAAELHVSIATIIRGAKALINSKGGFKDALKK